MRNVYIRKPQWTVTIKRPDYSQSTLSFETVSDWTSLGQSVDRVEFVSSEDRVDGVSSYTDLISYEYSNSVRSPSSPFNLSLTPVQDANGRTWKDKIKSKDLVYISEFGKIRYIGVVKNTSYSMSLRNEAPNRSVNITGESIGGILEDFNIPMNIYLWYDLGTTAEAENRKLIDALTSNANTSQDLSGIFKLIKDSFFSVAFGTSSNGFLAVLNDLLNLDITTLEARYPMALKPFQQQSNNLWSIYRQIVPLPVYELFGVFKDDKYNLVCRETPFDLNAWNALKITKIDPIALIEQNLSDSDNEVYTHFYSTMPNSTLSANQIYANNDLREVSVFDDNKLPIYGYKQLEANFPFFDLDEGRTFAAKDFLKENSVRLYAWYKNNVEFQSGELKMMTIPDDNNEYINIGERVQYLQGTANSIEFYVEGVKRAMRYPETMTSVYSVTRGYEYGSSSVTVGGVTVQTPQVQKIQNLGQKLVTTEKEVVEG